MGDEPIVLNPDNYARTLRESAIAPDQASMRAAEISDGYVDRCIAEGRSFIVETVLSSDKFRGRVEIAIQSGFSIGMTFVTLCSPDLCVDRVRQRARA